MNQTIYEQVPVKRVAFVDHFRGFVGVLMILDHSSLYLNVFWKAFDKFDPLFWNAGQFALRYVGLIVAPGFLIINGAMLWLSYTKSMEKGASLWMVRRHLLAKGLFLVAIQLLWVNSSWSGFQTLRLERFGIIGTIGISMCMMVFLLGLCWQARLLIALAVLGIHPLLLTIQYEQSPAWFKLAMEFFVTAGKWNSYPILPWFALAMLGSVMAHGWFRQWNSTRTQLHGTMAVATLFLALAVIIRLWCGYCSIFVFPEFGDSSFFLDQKYPPSLFFSFWFFGLSLFAIAGLIALEPLIPLALVPLTIIGKVPLFFYLIHIPMLAIVTRRLGLFYREGEVMTSLIGAMLVFIIMLPLCSWFAAYKSRKGGALAHML